MRRRRRGRWEEGGGVEGAEMEGRAATWAARVVVLLEAAVVLAGRGVASMQYGQYGLRSAPKGVAYAGLGGGGHRGGDGGLDCG